MLSAAKWIKTSVELGEVAPLFHKSLSVRGQVAKAVLTITAMGVYEAAINGKRIGAFVLAPGWTQYYKRLQVQTYDVTHLLAEENELTVLVGKGWYHSRLGWEGLPFHGTPEWTNLGLIAKLVITYTDGTTQQSVTDDSWMVSESTVRFSEIYDGEIVDATVSCEKLYPVICFEGPTDTLIPQEGEEIREQETVAAAAMFRTPKGEVVVDFGQEITGYVQTTLTARAGEVVDLSFAEVMDKEGNFYTDNYRSAKAQYRYTCREGGQTYTPKLTFWGFRYIRINEFPGGVDNATLMNFRAIAVHSDMKRTGWLKSSHPLLNRLFDNIIWGQKGNFLDVPTDCPQRDERLGWTGDAQVFARTACLNYDTRRFFTKWLNDMRADQREDGMIPHVIPAVFRPANSSAAWGDAMAICPWEVYRAFGDPAILEQNYDAMCKWVEYVAAITEDPHLWTGGEHFGDWLGLDAPGGTVKGSTREAFIASAFHAHSLQLVIQAGGVLGREVSAYEQRYEKVLAAFRQAFPTYTTQTECVLAAHFRLAEDPQKAADQLADMVRKAGVQLQTGFVGTPYLLHVLSDYGHIELAYSLLLREEYPSWLYPVTKGATTIWEHWDGIMPDGGFWSADMNSYNHYAYGAVADWVYTAALGIRMTEAGYAKVQIVPHPDGRLEWMKGVVDTRQGRISSEWKKQEGLWRFDITTPVAAEIVIDGRSQTVSAGSYTFFTACAT